MAKRINYDEEQSIKTIGGYLNKYLKDENQQNYTCLIYWLNFKAKKADEKEVYYYLGRVGNLPKIFRSVEYAGIQIVHSTVARGEGVPDKEVNEVRFVLAEPLGVQPLAFSRVEEYKARRYL